MKLEKVERLIALLKANGCFHYKDGDFEIRLTTAVQPESPTVSRGTNLPASAAPPVEISIPHHVNEVQNLLKLSDNDLVDRLFPDYSKADVKNENL